MVQPAWGWPPLSSRCRLVAMEMQPPRTPPTPDNPPCVAPHPAQPSLSPPPHTGAADGSLKVWDRRKLPASGAAAAAADACLHVFAFHRDAIMRVEWHATARVSGRERAGGQLLVGKGGSRDMRRHRGVWRVCRTACCCFEGAGGVVRCVWHT